MVLLAGGNLFNTHTGLVGEEESQILLQPLLEHTGVQPISWQTLHYTCTS